MEHRYKFLIFLKVSFQKIKTKFEFTVGSSSEISLADFSSKIISAGGFSAVIVTVETVLEFWRQRLQI